MFQALSANFREKISQRLYIIDYSKEVSVCVYIPHIYIYYRSVATFATMLKSFLCTYYVKMFKIMAKYAK